MKKHVLSIIRGVLIITAILAIAACGKKKSHEELYFDYSAQLDAKFEELLPEMKAEAESGKSESDLDEICAKKIAALEDIKNKGTDEMDALLAKSPATSNEYSRWSTKLISDFKDYRDRLQSTYKSASLDIYEEKLQDRGVDIDMGELQNALDQMESTVE